MYSSESVAAKWLFGLSGLSIASIIKLVLCHLSRVEIFSTSKTSIASIGLGILTQTGKMWTEHCEIVCKDNIFMTLHGDRTKQDYKVCLVQVSTYIFVILFKLLYKFYLLLCFKLHENIIKYDLLIQFKGFEDVS